jgi:hypothetical protein
MASPYERFIRARDFLQRHRTDYATAYRDYEQPELDEFNWALDYFDTQARANATPTWRPAPARSRTGCAIAACGAATACC